MSYLCTFTLYLLGSWLLSPSCSSHIFWPHEHLLVSFVSFVHVVLPCGFAFGYLQVMYLHDAEWAPVLSFHKKESLCLICPQKTAQALVSPALSSCIFITFSNSHRHPHHDHPHPCHRHRHRPRHCHRHCPRSPHRPPQGRQRGQGVVFTMCVIIGKGGEG